MDAFTGLQVNASFFSSDVEKIAMVKEISRSQAKQGGAILVLPIAGFPLSFEQIEESSQKPVDGSLAPAETRRTNVYRDSAGRVRTELGDSNEWIHIVDPVKSRVFILSAGTTKTGYTYSLPKSGEPKFVIFGLADVTDSPLVAWKSTTDHLGTRTIEGLQCEGTRISLIREDDPSITKTGEQWSSEDADLIVLLTVSKPSGSYTARIQNLRQGEPSPDLFTVPADYRIVEVPELNQQ